MRARILRPEEWERLRVPELPPSFPYTDPGSIAYVVVEDGDEILACMAVVKLTHFEGAWIAPEARGNAGVVRALLRQASAVAEVWGERWVMGGSTERLGPVAGYLSRLCGVPIPASFTAIPIPVQLGTSDRRNVCPQQ